MRRRGAQPRQELTRLYGTVGSKKEEEPIIHECYSLEMACNMVTAETCEPFSLTSRQHVTHCTKTPVDERCVTHLQRNLIIHESFSILARKIQEDPGSILLIQLMSTHATRWSPIGVSSTRCPGFMMTFSSQDLPDLYVTHLPPSISPS